MTKTVKRYGYGSVGGSYGVQRTDTPQPVRRRQVGQITSGGITNVGTGVGTALDKSEGSFFQPTRNVWRGPLEVLCVESWVARKAASVPVVDALLPWRRFESDDEMAVEVFQKAEKEHKLRNRLRRAMIAGRQYGTGFLAMMTKEAPLYMPLDVDMIRPGDLMSLLPLDRYDMSVLDRVYDYMNPDYAESGQAETYMVFPSRSGVPFRIHKSRLIRFDGLEQASYSGYTHYDQDWGVSILIPIITELLNDATIAKETAHLSMEASLKVLTITGLREKWAAGLDPDEVSAQTIGQQINQSISNHRLMMLEQGTESFDRVSVNMAGFAAVMDRHANRVAAAADIPATRMWGTPPVGMNATGEGDMRNHVLAVEADRNNTLPDRMETLDMVIARSAGLDEAPVSHWNSLLELSDQERALLLKTKTEALSIALNDNVIDEDEYREALDGDALLPPLPGPAPEVEDDPEMFAAPGGGPFGGPPMPDMDPMDPGMDDGEG